MDDPTPTPVPAAIISFTLAAIIAVLMVLGLDYMEKNHPDYDGKDLFDILILSVAILADCCDTKLPVYTYDAILKSLYYIYQN